MALQVWLPLTKDLRNQGLSNVTVTNNGATFNSAGKLGGCYQFGSSKNIKLMNYASTFSSFSEFSLSVWFKCTAQNTGHTGSALISCGNWNQAANLLNLALGYYSTDHYTKLLITNNTNWSYGYSYNFQLNTWYHVVLTSGKGKMRAYINGELIGDTMDAIVPTEMEQSWICIGNATYYSSFPFNGFMNDVRIYDHCLSPMEVKKLSQGLVLHYPLNRQGWGQENLITQAMINAEPWKSAIQGTYTVDGKTGWILSNSQLYSKSDKGANNIFSGLTYEANTQYTISFKWRDDYRTDGKPSSLYIRFKYSDGTYSQVISSKDYNYWKEEVMTSIAGKTVTAITTTYGNGGNLLFTDLKLEKGAIKTPTSPIVNSDLYNLIGLNSTTEYDTSGYCNNGTRTGTFSWMSDTPKYDVSAKFSGSNYILTDGGTFSWFDFNQLTLAGWMKPTNSPGSYSGSFGIAHNSIDGYYSKCFSISNSSSKFTINAAKGSTWVWITAPYTVPANEWHHYVATLNGTEVKMYVDGELVHSAAIDWGTGTVASDTRFQVGVDLPGSDETYQGYYSDIRIYATALSASDVKSLYESNKL